MSIYCPVCGQPTEYLTVKQVAQILGRPEVTVRKQVQRGVFPGSVRAEGVSSKFMWRIPTSAVLPLVRR